MFSCILFDLIQILDFFFFNNVPNCSIEHIQIAKNFAIAEHFAYVMGGDRQRAFRNAVFPKIKTDKPGY